MERHFDNRMQMPSTCNGPADFDKIASNINTLNSCKHRIYELNCLLSGWHWLPVVIVISVFAFVLAQANVHPLIAPQYGGLLERQDANVGIDIHMETPPSYHSGITNENPVGEHDVLTFETEKNTEDGVKQEPKLETETEAMDLSNEVEFNEFDPIAANASFITENGAAVPEPLDCQTQPGSLSSAQPQKLKSLKIKLF